MCGSQTEIILLAIEQYGKAIDCNPLSAVYHANRAFAHIRLETYGSAVEDAAQAIALDPKYVKVWSNLVYHMITELHHAAFG